MEEGGETARGGRRAMGIGSRWRESVCLCVCVCWGFAQVGWGALL